MMVRLETAGARYVTLERAQSDSAYAEAGHLPGGGSMLQRAAKAKSMNLSEGAQPKAVIDVKQLCR